MNYVNKLKFLVLRILSTKLFKRGQNIATLRGATIEGEWGVLRTKAGYIISDAWGDEGRGLQFIFRRLVKERGEPKFYKYLVGFNSNSASVHVQKAIYLVPSSGLTLEQPNYFHWLLETLPGICVLRNDNSLGDYKILLRKNSPQWVYDSLLIFGISLSRVVETSDQSRIHVDRLVVPKVFWISSFFISRSPYLMQLRDTAVTKAAEDARGLVYFARGENERRRPENDTKIKNLVIALGGMVYEPGELTVKQQKEICNDAHTLLLPCGASLANAIWLPRGGHLVVLEANEDVQSSCVPQLAEMFDLRLSIVNSRTIAARHGKNDNYVSNLFLIKKILINCKYGRA